MSAGSTTPKLVKPLGIIGLIILIIACFYQANVWNIISFSDFSSSTPLISDSAKKDAAFDPNTIGTFYKVEKVIDGDTFYVNIRGVNEKVRLLGVNTPETIDPYKPVQCYGKESYERLKEIILGKLVQLRYDYTQGTRDVYNRLLVYAYLEDGQMVNRKLLAEGYAYEYTYLTPYIFRSEFREIQNLARTSKRGLWSEDTCNGSRDFPQ